MLRVVDLACAAILVSARSDRRALFAASITHIFRERMLADNTLLVHSRGRK